MATFRRNYSVEEISHQKGMKFSTILTDEIKKKYDLTRIDSLTLFENFLVQRLVLLHQKRNATCSIKNQRH